MPRFRKKPVVVEARQWDGTASHATQIIDWVLTEGGTATYRCDGPDGCPGTEGAHYLVIRTLEGDMLADEGAWIVCGTAGEFYPVKDSIFWDTYEEAHDG